MLAPVASHQLKHSNFLRGLLKDPRRGAEIGVERGIFTEQMLTAFPRLHLYAVDLWAVREPRDREGYLTYEDWPLEEIKADFDARARPFADRLTVLHMHSGEAADQVPDGSLDFVFIDAEHTFEGVSTDIIAWSSKVKAGGILAGHDYGDAYPGVAKAVDRYCPKANVDALSTVWCVRIC